MINTDYRDPDRDRAGRSNRIERRPRPRNRLRPRIEALEAKALLSFSPLSLPPPTGGGTITALTNSPPNNPGAGTMLLETNGTVLMEGGGVSKSWYTLTPNSTGSYSKGTWNQVASANLQRLYFGSNVLPDGRVFVLGGEYSGPTGAQNTTNTGEIYDPVKNTWTNIANFPQSSFGDDPTEVLADGTVLAGYLFGGQTYIYTPATNKWAATGTKLRGDRSDEESWVTLPDHSILSYDIFASGTSGAGHAQRYIPSTGTWVDAGSVPVVLSGSGDGSELGPGFLLPDGRVLYFGANGNSAFYTESTNSWATGPPLPAGLGLDDAPGAELPDGKILLTADTPLFNGPAHLFEFDPTQTTTLTAYTDLTSSLPAGYLSRASYVDRMLVLPTGEVLINNGSSQLEVFTPNPDTAASTPTISGVGENVDTSFTMTGTALNGISEGAAYGDDVESASNYPIINFTDSNGNVYYARTFGWTSQVATGSAPVTTNFSLPAKLPVTSYQVRVIANGSASAPLNETNPATVNAATATPNPDPGTSASLAVLGNDALGESSLTYTWATTSQPNGAPAPTFSTNGTNAAKNDTVTFKQAGNYTFAVTYKNAVGLTTTSSVSVVVSQSVKTLTIAPQSVTLAQSGTQQFTASATDQFGATFTPSSTDSVASGGAGGTISPSGLYTAPANGYGIDTVLVAAGSLTASATVTVTQPPIITLQPVAQTVTAGQTVTFTAAASGYPTPTVQWYESTDGINFIPAPGASTATSYSFTAARSQSGTLFEAIFTNSIATTITQTALLTVNNAQATIQTTTVNWGVSGTSSLTTVADGLRLLPAGRSNDLPWLGINQVGITLDQAGTLSTADVTVTGLAVANYGPVTISGSGTSYVITLGVAITVADRVTITISNATIANFTRRLDVLPGDVNDDGVVTSADGVAANIYLGIDDLFAEVTGNSGVVTLADLKAIRAKNGTTLPPLV